MTEATNTPSNVAKFVPMELVISKTENKKRVEVGKLNIFVPLLAHALPIIATATIKKDDKGNDMIEDGIPVYESDEANWIQDAFIASLKAQVRNKLVPNTATLREGQSIPTNWQELVAEGSGRGAGAALKLLAEFRKAFSDWVAKQGLAEAAANTLIALVSAPKNLSLQPDVVKDKVSARVAAFAESLSEEDTEKFMRPLDAISEATKPLENAEAALNF